MLDGEDVSAHLLDPIGVDTFDVDRGLHDEHCNKMRDTLEHVLNLLLAENTGQRFLDGEEIRCEANNLLVGIRRVWTA